MIKCVALLALVAATHADWDCAPPPGQNCQRRLGPAAGQDYAEWEAELEAWVATGREFFDFAAYDNPDIQWGQTSFVQPQAMLHDRYLYDREAGEWTVDRYLDDVEQRYGGIDSVLVWQYYPNSGTDDRNNFDMIYDLPGGLAGVQSMVAAFQARGVRVLWACFPWDHGTRNTGRPEYVDLVEAVLATGADGINGDTMAGVNVSFWNEAFVQGDRALMIEPEIMQNGAGAIVGLETNMMSWAQFWSFQYVPLVAAYKALEPRHLQRTTQRWATNHTDAFQTSFFNGIGFSSWENVWGIFNQLTDFHAEMLRRMSTVLRNVNGGGRITSGPAVSWRPHVPVTVQAGVFASEFSNETHRFYTVVNRDNVDKGGQQLTVSCEPETVFFDLYHGEVLQADCDESGLASLAFDLEPAGFGAVLSTEDGSRPPESFLTRMAELSAVPLASFSDVWAPLQQVFTQTDRTPPQHLPDGMVDVPTVEGWLFESYCNNIEPTNDNDIPSAVGVQMPWEETPRRQHSQELNIQSFFIDIFPVTNADYAAYLGASGYQPADDHNWLRDWTDAVVHNGTVGVGGGSAAGVAAGRQAARATVLEQKLPFSYPEGWENHPVRWVSRVDAEAYCRYYGKRLPHTWEWQLAAQGEERLTYPWGNDWDETMVPPLSTARAAPPAADVDAHPDAASPFGVLDLVGNVYQWTDESCDEHTCMAVLRGGSNYRPSGSQWYFPQPGCESTGGASGRFCVDPATSQVRGDLGQL